MRALEKIDKKVSGLDAAFLLEPVTLNNKERMERWFAGGSL